MRKLNILIAGSTGYIGIQLIKLLIKHKYVKIKYLCGNNSVGKKISFFDKSLKSKKLPKITKFNKKYLNNIDVIFTALPNGQAQEISNVLNSYDVKCSVKGGVLSGQAGAIIHGLSRALVSYDETLKTTLKKEKLTTRDSRVVERKQ